MLTTLGSIFGGNGGMTKIVLVLVLLGLRDGLDCSGWLCYSWTDTQCEVFCIISGLIHSFGMHCGEISPIPNQMQARQTMGMNITGVVWTMTSAQQGDRHPTLSIA